jgi:hypothetical protein
MGLWVARFWGGADYWQLPAGLILGALMIWENCESNFYLSLFGLRPAFKVLLFWVDFAVALCAMLESAKTGL